jgi:type II secretory pathway component PulF
MPLYFYQAYAKDGKKITGYLDGQSTAQVKEQLVRQGMYPISITTAREEQRLSLWQRLFAKSVTTKDKVIFTKQLAVLLKAGVPLLQAVELLSEQFTGKMRAMLTSVKDDLREGSSFANALNKFPHIFDKTYIQLVRAGEASGKLETILERLTGYIERREEINKKVKSAMTMPIIQLAVVVIVVVALLIFVVPNLAQVFAAQNQKLPWTTQMLMNVSSAFTNYWWLILIVVSIIVGIFLYWKSTPKGARTFDRVILKLPIVGNFVQLSAVVQFSQTLGMLLQGGVNLSESLDIVCKIIDNRVLADALNEARDKIIKQGKIAQYLKQTNVFPPIATYMISTGEESGQLDFMLLTIAQNYEEELKETADTLTAALGPILIIFVSVIVGFIVLSIAMPMTQMGQGLGL